MTTDVPAAFDPAVPLQHQVYLQLRSEIGDGLWLGRDDFPGEKELARRFGVSVITSRAALDRLAREGWVERQRGRGTRAVHVPVPESGERRPALFPVGRAQSYRYQVLFADVRVAPADACAAFGLEVGSELWQCSRLRTFRGRPHSVTHNAQRPELGQQHSKRDLQSKSMAAIFAASGHEIARLRRRVGVTHPPPEVATYLGITMGDPVLLYTFTVYDPDDAPLEWVRLFLATDQSPPEETIDVKTGTWSSTAPL